jgi:hypothetical protein
MGLLQRKHAIGVVGMMVGHQNMGEGPAARLQRLVNRRSVGGVDGGRLAGGRIVKQDAVIVGKDRKLKDLKRRHRETL